LPTLFTKPDHFPFFYEEDIRETGDPGAGDQEIRSSGTPIKPDVLIL
jgi:hypothetical protein